MLVECLLLWVLDGSVLACPVSVCLCKNMFVFFLYFGARPAVPCEAKTRGGRGSRRVGWCERVSSIARPRGRGLKRMDCFYLLLVEPS